MKRFIATVIATLSFFSAGALYAYTQQDCIDCHGRKKSKSQLHIPVEKFEASVHAQEDITCMDCHTGVKDDSHQETPGAGDVDCGQCHDQQNRHGPHGLDNRPQCHSCHSKHNILAKDAPDSSVNPKRLKTTCRRCHPTESGDTDYLSWLPSWQIASHKKANFGRDYGRSNCIGCHQGQAAHGETDVINEQDCYRCHASRRGKSLLLGFMHPRADIESQPGIFSAALVYQLLIALLLIGGFGFWVRRFSGKSKKEK